MSPALPSHPHIEMLPLSSLTPHPTNAKVHSDQQIQQIGASIVRFGFISPIIDDRNMIAAGHGRWAAAKRLLLSHVPVIRTQFLTEADRRAFALADNRIAELSGWDEDLLADELTFLFESGHELEITGFSIADLDLSVPEDKSASKLERVELPDPAADAISRSGDLWRIGQHRLYCGDARLPESYEALLGNDRADMVFADPPYGVKIDGHVSGLGKVRHREFAMMSGEQPPAELTAFFRMMFRQCVRFSRSGSIHFQCMDWRHMREILDAADGVYTEFKQLVVWAKTNFKAGKGSHVNNFGLGETGRYRTNVWDIAGANTFRKGRAKDLADHRPSSRPRSSRTRSSTARIAAIWCSTRSAGRAPRSSRRTRPAGAARRGAAIEIDPLYVDTALRRLAAAAKLVAVHEDGRSFDDVARDRKAERETIDG